MDRSADELIAARAFHAIDTEVSAADTNGVLRGPGPRWIVLGGDKAMARVERSGNGYTKIDIAQSHDAVGCGIDDIFHGGDIFEAINAPNELDIAGTPGRVGIHRLHVFLARFLSAGIVPGKGQVDNAGRDLDRLQVGDFAFGILYQLDDLGLFQLSTVEVDLQ